MIKFYSNINVKINKLKEEKKKTFGNMSNKHGNTLQKKNQYPALEQLGNGRDGNYSPTHRLLAYW
jgi:hypothetical protein